MNKNRVVLSVDCFFFFLINFVYFQYFILKKKKKSNINVSQHRRLDLMTLRVSSNPYDSVINWCISTVLSKTY